MPDAHHDAAELAAELAAGLIAVATHELRAPLTALVGFSSALRDDWRNLSPADLETCVAAIDRQAQRLTGLVDDLFAASLVDAGVGRLDLAWVDIAPVVAAACTDSQAERTHELVVKLPPALPAVWADSHSLQRVLVNLIVNAARYSRRGSRVEVSASVGPSQVSIAVRDHGPGIDPAVRDHLFDKFARGQDGPRASSGIGLYVVRQLSELMGAIVAVESEPGHGSCFTVSLTRAERALRAVVAAA